MTKIDRRPLAAMALCTLAMTASGAEVDLPRFPALSPDGETVTFSWRGDLWSASTDGGDAVRLTSHPADETRSAWSPDGTQIAFESRRDGPRAIYVMNTTGGDVRRVSLSDDSLTLHDWTGMGLYVSGRIEGDVYRAERPYVVDPEGSEPVRLHDAFGQNATGLDDGADGRVVFERGGSRLTRRHYRGPDDRDLFLYDPADNSFTRLTGWEGNDALPAMRDDDTVLYLSDREDRTVNIYAMDLDENPPAVRRLTDHDDRDVTALAVSGDGRTVAYVKWDGLHVASFTGDRLRNDRRLRLSAPADATPRDELMTISSVSEGAVSPDGGTLAVVAMGDVYVRATEEDAPTRRVTDSMARARDIAWSLDNTTLYFTSDEDGTESIYAATVTLTRDELKDGFTEATSPAEEEEPAQEEAADEDASDDEGDDASEDEDEKEEKKDKGPKADERWADALRFDIEHVYTSANGVVRDLAPSPDGTKLAFRETRGDIKILDLESGDITTLYETWDFSTEFHWSPDSMWIAYATDDSDYNADIFIVPADGSADPINITRHPDLDYSPRWSADGKMLAFLSTRINDQADVMIVMLDRDLEAKTDAELETYFDEANKAVKKLGALDPKEDDENADADADEKDEEEYEAPFTVEDLETAYLRLRRVTSYDGSEGSLAISGDGSTLVFSASNGPDGSGMYTSTWNGRDVERRGSPGSVQHVTRDGQTLVMVRGGTVRTMPVKGGKETSHPVRSEKKIDHARLSAQKFRELSRGLGTTFYHPTMKGLDWEGLTEDYLQLASRAHTQGEFNWIASYFMGELNGSHLGAWGGVGGYSAPDYRSSGSLAIESDRVPIEGGAFGYDVTRVLPLATTQVGEMALQEGDIITAIDFEPFGARDTLDMHLAGKTGDEVVLTVMRDVEGETKELHLLRTPVSSGAEGRLRYDDWQQSRRELVDELSGGRIGYLHIRAMGTQDLIEFERDLFAAAEGKDGLLIDVRSNGGGWTTDRVLGSIMYTPHAYTIARGGHPIDGQGYPRDRLFIQKYNLPINMLCNEKSFSNAEIISHAFKTLERGTLVGEETYGGVISTGSFRLVDGTTVRRPFRGWFLPDGTDMENNGAMPDIRIEQTPEDESAGIDRQLEAAVEDLMNRL